MANRPGSSLKKDVMLLVRACRAAGYEVVVGGGNHWKVLDPKTGSSVASLAVSPSDTRFYRQAVSDLIRVGVLKEDPKKAGYTSKTPALPFISSRQTTVRDNLTELRAEGFTDDELIQHYRTMNPDSTWGVIYTSLAQISESAKETEWSTLGKWEDVIVDITSPKKEEVVAVPTKKPRGGRRSLSLGKDEQEKLNQYSQELARWAKLDKRQIGGFRVSYHGQWTLAADVALEQARRKGVTLEQGNTSGAVKPLSRVRLAGRMRDLGKGLPGWSNSLTAARLFISGYEDGLHLDASASLTRTGVGSKILILNWKPKWQASSWVPPEIIWQDKEVESITTLMEEAELSQQTQNGVVPLHMRVLSALGAVDRQEALDMAMEVKMLEENCELVEVILPRIV